ncbi:MAG: hypothetical protein IPH13_13065 [Planctomycetes bacterium]|nr:hypothetical protein [Planctomycetota bacterium]MCC7172916.1 hypothetical protein [Planctomycetota bacterium]
MNEPVSIVRPSRPASSVTRVVDVDGREPKSIERLPVAARTVPREGEYGLGEIVPGFDRGVGFVFGVATCPPLRGVNVEPPFEPREPYDGTFRGGLPTFGVFEVPPDDPPLDGEPKVGPREVEPDDENGTRGALLPPPLLREPAE